MDSKFLSTWGPGVTNFTEGGRHLEVEVIGSIVQVCFHVCDFHRATSHPPPLLHSLPFSTASTHKCAPATAAAGFPQQSRALGNCSNSLQSRL